MNAMAKSFICSIVLSLTGCSLYPFNAHYQGDTQNEKQLPDQMLLAEKKHWSQLEGNRYWVIGFSDKPYHSNFIELDIPTYAQFKNNPERWKHWQGDAFYGRARIIGILDKGTRFHILDVASSSNVNNCWMTIEIDSGPYKGEIALYPARKTQHSLF